MLQKLAEKRNLTLLNGYIVVQAGRVNFQLSESINREGKKTGSLESKIRWLCLGWMPAISLKITALELGPKGEGPWDNLQINC